MKEVYLTDSYDHYVRGEWEWRADGGDIHARKSAPVNEIPVLCVTFTPKDGKPEEVADITGDINIELFVQLFGIFSDTYPSMTGHEAKIVVQQFAISIKSIINARNQLDSYNYINECRILFKSLLITGKDILLNSVMPRDDKEKKALQDEFDGIIHFPRKEN